MIVQERCLQLLFGKEEGLCHFRDTSVRHWWKHNWKNPRLEVEA
ncbi:unnamed protein product [Gulo gulo]|uniref:Uncharacterized protein n=1 Tax=Gulo gulo TaxID=48420 RepID=A0A9X9Q9Y0_GULGU|nr:unnamed protein product [Gulo gulo]